jgi:hypothetical protein
MPGKYYVESYPHHGIKAEASASFEAFDDAYRWIEQRLRENGQRKTRLLTSETITPAQSDKLARYTVERT